MGIVGLEGDRRVRWARPVTSSSAISSAETYHSIIGSNDEVVPCSSSHPYGAASEQIVPSGHSVQKTTAAIRALLRSDP